MTIAHVRFGEHGSDEPFVLVHGLGSRWQAWEPLIPELARERDVIAVDLPGFGRTPPFPAAVEPSPRALAGAVAELLDALGVARAHVVGHSLGGWVALEVGALGRAASITAVAPGGFWTPAERIYAKALLRSLRAAARAVPIGAARALLGCPVARRLAMGLLFACPERIPTETLVEDLRAFAQAPGYDGALEAAARRPWEGPADLGCPVVIAWGDRDRILLFRQAERARRAIRGARLVVLRGAGHTPFYEDAEGVLAAIRAAALAPAGAAP